MQVCSLYKASVAATTHWLTPLQVPSFTTGLGKVHVELVFCPEKSDGPGGISTKDPLISQAMS